MNKRRLTFRRYFKNYKSDGLIATIRLDRTDENDDANVVITEQEEDWVDYDTGRIIVRPKFSDYFLVGEVANRLYEYEQLGYSPEELKEIVDDRKKLKERLKSIYGDVFDENVESLYPRLFVARGHGKSIMQTEHVLKNFYGATLDAKDMISLKAKIAVLDEINKNKSMVQYVEYSKADVENTQALYGRISRKSGPYPWGWNIPEIDNVIFNDPATIIFWKDGTKTIVKADKEDFDPEKGLAMAISKKALGNKGNYFDIFKKWAGKLAKEYADIRARKKQDEYEPVWCAEQRLHNALDDKKATKADLRAAMEDAIKYLNNEKEN